MSVINEIAAERRRQIEVEGWTAEHDDEHRENELSEAAAWYALTEGLRRGLSEIHDADFWPWDPSWFKPGNPLIPAERRRDLIKAAALIVAEIERLDRATPPVAGSGAEG